MYALRRGWLVVLVLALLCIACARSAWSASAADYATVTVRPGDTVWSIAAQRYPGADTRDKVGEIMAANGLHDALLRPGQKLRVPSS